MTDFTVTVPATAARLMADVMKAGYWQAVDATAKRHFDAQASVGAWTEEVFKINPEREATKKAEACGLMKACWDLAAATGQVSGTRTMHEVETAYDDDVSFAVQKMIADAA